MIACLAPRGAPLSGNWSATAFAVHDGAAVAVGTAATGEGGGFVAVLGGFVAAGGLVAVLMARVGTRTTDVIVGSGVIVGGSVVTVTGT